MPTGMMTAGYSEPWLSRKLVAGIGRDEGGGSCGDLGPEEDVVSEVVEAPDERGALGCLLVEERLSEFLERNSFGEHVEHRHQDLVRDGGPLRASARLQPVVLVLVVAALGPGGAGLNGLEVNVALAGGRALLLSGALVIAGADPGCQALGVAEHGHVDADLRDDRHRDPVVNAGDLPEQAPLRLVGPGLFLDALVECAQIRLDRLDPEVEGQHIAVMLGQPAIQRQGSSLRRNFRLAKSAISCGVAVFSISAFSIARPETPNTSLTTLASLMFQQLERAVLLGGQRLGHGAAEPDEIAQFTDWRW